MVKTLKISSSLESKGNLLLDLVCSIGDVGPSRFAQTMNQVDLDLLYGKVKFDS